MTDIPTYHRGDRNFGTGYDMMKQIETLEDEIERLRAAIVKSQWALQPFSGCVFNDNGDCTVTPRPFKIDRYIDAHFAYKACRAALTQEGK